MNIFKKTVAASLAALTLAAAVASAPAQAARFPRGTDFAGSLFGGLILGGIAAAAAEHERRCGVVRQPIIDEDGSFSRYRKVRYC